MSRLTSQIYVMLLPRVCFIGISCTSIFFVIFRLQALLGLRVAYMPCLQLYYLFICPKSRMPKNTTEQNTYSSHFFSADIYSRKVFLHAFMAIRKTSGNFSHVSPSAEKIRLIGVLLTSDSNQQHSSVQHTVI